MADLMAKPQRPTEPAAGDPDQDILELIARGDLGGALEALMRRHGRAVYRYCREALHDPTLADDVQQQVFIQAYRDLPKVRGGSMLRTWLFAIARHRVLDAAKSRGRAYAHIEDDELADTPDPSPPPDQQIDDAVMLEALLGCVAALPEGSRTAVLLRYQQGFTFEDMAEICREKAGTLQARTARALMLLRGCLTRQLGLRR
jgi:RNA polymerase sigma-70 factor (ECF subfamily)